MRPAGLSSPASLAAGGWGVDRNHGDVTSPWSGAPRCDTAVVPRGVVCQAGSAHGRSARAGR